MAQTGRASLSAAARDELWMRYRAGESMAAIARVLGKRVETIYYIVRRQGGVAPPVRRRARGALTSGDREASA